MPLKAQFFFATQEKASDRSLMEENVIRSLGGVCPMLQGKEDHTHLFFECSVIKEIWTNHLISQADISTAEAFLDCLCDGVSSRPVDQGGF